MLFLWAGASFTHISDSRASLSCAGLFLYWWTICNLSADLSAHLTSYSCDPSAGHAAIHCILGAFNPRTRCITTVLTLRTLVRTLLLDSTRYPNWLLSAFHRFVVVFNPNHLTANVLCARLWKFDRCSLSAMNFLFLIGCGNCYYPTRWEYFDSYSSRSSESELPSEVCLGDVLI